ncbi:MAG: radical SAM protein [Candidatus Diapherotrites archaeon]
MGNQNRLKRFRVNGLSFREEIEGKTLPFGKRIIYLGLNGVLQPCNWACKYCLEGSPQERIKKNENSLNLSEQLNLIDNAGELGIKGLLITGGEPLAPGRYYETARLVKRADEQGIVPLIYTNGSYLNKEMAEELANCNTSIALKLDSRIPERYDMIAGRKGAYKSTMGAIKILKKTSIGRPAAENEKEILVRMLFSTVGSALNTDEYVSIARFATENNARWMMEAINYRGSASVNEDLRVDPRKHAESMKYALLLNPEQDHSIGEQGYCRLFYMVTVNTSNGCYGSCPQDYAYLGNIRENSLKEASEKVLEKMNDRANLETWSVGECPVKANKVVYA